MATKTAQSSDDEQASQKATQLAISKFGRLDGMVINHGALSPMTRLADASVEEWKRLYDVNFFSALALVSPDSTRRDSIIDRKEGQGDHTPFARHKRERGVCVLGRSDKRIYELGSVRVF